MLAGLVGREVPSSGGLAKIQVWGRMAFGLVDGKPGQEKRKGMVLLLCLYVRNSSPGGDLYASARYTEKNKMAASDRFYTCYFKLRLHVFGTCRALFVPASHSAERLQ